MVEPHLLYFFLLFLCLYLPARILGPRLLEEEGSRNQEAARPHLWPLILVLILGTPVRDSRLPDPGPVPSGRNLRTDRVVYPWFLCPAVLFYLAAEQPTGGLPNRAIPVRGSGKGGPYVSPHPAAAPGPLSLSVPPALMRKGLVVPDLCGNYYPKNLFLSRPNLAFILPGAAELPLAKNYRDGPGTGALHLPGSRVFHPEQEKLVGDSIVGKGRTWQEVRLYSPEIKYLFKRFNASGEGFD